MDVLAARLSEVSNCALMRADGDLQTRGNA